MPEGVDEAKVRSYLLETFNLEIGAGLALDADIMLMDEAFSALDPLIRKEMQDELLRLQDILGAGDVLHTVPQLAIGIADAAYVAGPVVQNRYRLHDHYPVLLRKSESRTGHGKSARRRLAGRRRETPR